MAYFPLSKGNLSMENDGAAGGLANPERRCIKRRNALPLCAYEQVRQGQNDLGEPVEVIELCRSCDRGERNRLSAIRSGQRRIARRRRLRADNRALNANFAEVLRIHQESLTEQEMVRDLMAAAQVAKIFMEEIRTSDE